MAITPINVTRVSHGLRTQSLLQTLRTNTIDLFRQQTQLATGRKFNTPADDPVAAAQSLKFNDAIGRQEQILSNLQHADLMLGSSDQALNDVSALLSEAEAIASQSLGPLASADEREANAAVVASIRDRLMNIGNLETRGMFLFAGRATQSPPFSTALGGVAYTGDTGDVLSRVALFEQEAINMPGNVLFGALTTSIGATADLQPVLTEDTRIEDLAGANGQGVRKGTIVLTDGGDTTIPVDISSADTIGDLADMIANAAEQGGLNATVAIGDRSLSVSGVTIRDTDTGKTASDLGLAATADEPALGAGDEGGIDLRPRVTANTRLENLNGGEGVSLDGGLIIRNGSASAVVDTSEAKTVQDVINRINAAGLYVRARVNEAGSGIEIVGQVSGVTLSVTESEGETAASLGLRSFGEDTRLETLNFGAGVGVAEGQTDLRITAKDGSSVDVNLDGAETVGDVIELINEAATDAGVGVTASVGTTVNAIAIEDTSGGDGALSVGRAHIESTAVDDLGLLKSVGEEDATELVGDEVSAVRADGVFTALLDLESALRADDEPGIIESAQRLTEFSEDMTRIHGVIGAKAQSITSRVERTENAVIATKTLLSQIEDLDYTEAVTRFQQAQTALQANLLSGSQLLNLSLLDFLG